MSKNGDDTGGDEDDLGVDEFSREDPTKPGSAASVARVEASAFANIARAIDGVAAALEQIPGACERISQDRRSAFYASVATRLGEGAELFHEMRRWVQSAARLEEQRKTTNGHGGDNR